MKTVIASEVRAKQSQLFKILYSTLRLLWLKKPRNDEMQLLLHNNKLCSSVLCAVFFRSILH